MTHPVSEAEHVALTGTDERGVSCLKLISPFEWVGAAITAGVKGRMVPEDFYARDLAEDGSEIVVIACPCGHSPQVPRLSLVACECQRFYFNGIAEVWSLNAPTAPGRTLEGHVEAERTPDGAAGGTASPD